MKLFRIFSLLCVAVPPYFFVSAAVGLIPAAAGGQSRGGVSSSPKSKEPEEAEASSARRREEWRRRSDAITSRSMSERELANASLESGAKVVAPVSEKTIAPILETKATKSSSSPARVATARLTSIYLVGVGDTLAIHARNAPGNAENHYVVLSGGLVEHPLLPKPLVVSGLPVEKIAANLNAELQRDGVHTGIELVVSVKNYASHAVIVSGLVAEPGYKIFQREAIPLFVILADAQPLERADILTLKAYGEGEELELSLKDTAAMQMLVRPGDVIMVSKKTTQFYYIGGEVAAPGQKQFQPGTTLSQAIQAAGSSTVLATTANSSTTGSRVKLVTITRQKADGKLTTYKHDLAAIRNARAFDPVLQPGDRIEVSP